MDKRQHRKAKWRKAAFKPLDGWWLCTKELKLPERDEQGEVEAGKILLWGQLSIKMDTSVIDVYGDDGDMDFYESVTL